MARTDDELRALFRADAERIRPDDLRPAAAFPPPRVRRPGRFAVAAAMVTAAATTVVLVAVQSLHRPPAPAPRAAEFIAPAAPQSIMAAPRSDGAGPLVVGFTTRTARVSPPGVDVAVPEPDVRSGDPVVAGRVSGVLGAMLGERLSAFRNRARESVALGIEPGRMTATVRVGETVAWRHFWSVRFDSTMGTGQAYPANESVAATFDTGTGARVLTTDLFTDVARATGVVRAALLASRTDGSLDGFDLSGISLRPAEDGSTTMVNCYPAAAGLRCLVDQGSLAPHAAGRIEATVPWGRLAPLLRPGVTG